MHVYHQINSIVVNDIINQNSFESLKRFELNLKSFHSSLPVLPPTKKLRYKILINITKILQENESENRSITPEFARRFPVATHVYFMFITWFQCIEMDLVCNLLHWEPGIDKTIDSFHPFHLIPLAANACG